MLTVMINIVQFAWWTVRRDKTRKSHCNRYGPVYILIVAAILVNIQPVCMLVIGSWKLPNFFFNGGDTGTSCQVTTACAGSCMSSAFVCSNVTGTCIMNECGPMELGCTCSVASAIVPNTTTGWCVQILGTYLGFAFLFVGVFGATKLHLKLMKKWNAIRGKQRERKAKAAPAPVDEEDCKT